MALNREEQHICSVCDKNKASKKLSILVCPEHYDVGKPEMVELLRKLERWFDRQQKIKEEEEKRDDSPVTQEEAPVVIEPQPIPNAPQPTQEDPEKTIDWYIHEACNKARGLSGHRAMAYDEALEMIAYKHSKDMVTRDYVSHTTPEGRSYTDRYRLSNYTGCRNTGENIAWFSTSRLGRMTRKEVADKIFNQWWISKKGHKESILNPDFTIEGIGIYISGSKVMATQCFCRK